MILDDLYKKKLISPLSCLEEHYGSLDNLIVSSKSEDSKILDQIRELVK